MFTIALLIGAFGALSGCSEVPEDRYGVNRLRLIGVEQMDEYALRACLATTQRRRQSIPSTERECNDPPFEDRLHVRIPLWRAGWPLYDRSVFERDLQRIVRWYRARGFYDTEVTRVTYSPPEAEHSDRVDAGLTCERTGDDEGCELEITVEIEEGEPVLVRNLVIDGDRELSSDLRASVSESITLRRGERFDEYNYEQSKAGIQRALHNATFACSQVEGEVEVDPEGRTADIRYTLSTGVAHVIGNVTLTGEQDLRRPTILATADLKEGDDFTDQLLSEARHAVYALGTFASVDVVGTPRRENGECIGIVDVEIRVSPGRRFRYGLGGGFASGITSTGFEQVDVLQWDIHLLGFIEHRNFLGGLRRLRIEDRPKLIFPNTFPRAVATYDNGETIGPRPGNELRLEFRQPAFIEARTTLVVTGRWDYGLDPIDAFFRHNIDATIGLRRNFLDGRISAAFGIHYNLFLSDDDPQNVTHSDYSVIFLEQQLTFDFRDDTRNPRLGLYFGLDLQEAAFLDWNYLRVVPEMRGYAPLGPLVLAGRFRLGWMQIFSASNDLDAIAAQLGPQPYRLRSGGASSHRGFVAGFLGEENESIVDLTRGGGEYRQNSGGIRRWELSLELRLPIGDDLGLVTFADMGDVNRDPSFRFDYVRLALGLGIRYHTLIGPFRLDFAWLVPGAQRIGSDAGLTRGRTTFFGLFRGAFHLTIGEAF